MKNNIVLKKCSCSYSKKKQDVSGITPLAVANDAVERRQVKGLFPKRLVSFY